MMKISEVAGKASKFAADNSPAILTAIGVTGTITTAYLTGKASIKASRILEQRDKKVTLDETHTNVERLPLTNKKKFMLVWMLYIPPVATGVLTITSIIMANRIGSRRAAAMASVYAISERALVEYKDKVAEKFGETKSRQVHDEIVQDRLNANPPVDGQIHITGNGDVLCKDEYTQRYFKSSMETLKKAQNDINYQIIHHDYATLSDFYDLLHLAHTSISDDIGWNNTKMLELLFSTALTEDGQPCISFDFGTVPMRFPGHGI